MIRTVILAAIILLIFISLVGCSSGLSDGEIDASVEARLAIAQTATAEAVPAVTATPVFTNTPVSTDTPIPTDTVAPTNTPEININWSDEAFPLAFKSYFTGKRHEIYPVDVTSYFPDLFDEDHSSLTIIVEQHDNGETEMSWAALYRGADLIHLDGVRIKVGDMTYDLSDRLDKLEGLRGDDGRGRYVEYFKFPFRHQDVEILVDLLENEGTARLEGSDGEEDIPLGRDDISTKTLFAAMALFESLSEE